MIKRNNKKPEYQILGDKQQILQVVLFNGDEFFINAPVLYGSQLIYTKIRASESILFRILSIITQRLLVILPIKNEYDQVEYFAVRKDRGKILCLDLDLYKDTYVNIDKLLAFNFQYQSANYQHPKLGFMKKIAPKDPQPNDMVFVQGNSTTYIEKELGIKEQFVCKSQMLMACSEAVKITVKGHDLQLQGPGFVFIEPNSRSAKNSQRIMVLMGVLSFVVILEFLTIVFAAD